MTFEGRSLAAIVLITGLAGAPVAAHHYFAATFDATKTIRFTGVVTRIELVNPHSHFYLDVKDDDGSVQQWACEAGPPNALSRQGWTRSTVSVGDAVIVDGIRAKDGSRSVIVRRVSLPDGRTIAGVSAGNGGQP